MLERAQIESASDIAERELFEAIVDGRLSPGSPLRLKELAAQLGTSMMPVREAIGRLAALDLVEIEPRKGARVRELTLRDLEDTYFSRMHLECLAVWEAAQHFTAEDSAKAAQALVDKEAAQVSGDRVAARDAHERFHFALYEASGRTWLVRSILPGWRNSERYRESGEHLPVELAERSNEHQQLLAALIRGDGVEAVRWMATHLSTSVRLAARNLPEGAGATLEIPHVEEIIGKLAAPIG